MDFDTCRCLMEDSFLEKFSMFTQYRILESEEACISFLQQYEIIPKKEDTPPLCLACSSGMRVYLHRHLKMGWGWKCYNYECLQTVRSLKDTFFETIRIPFKDVIAFTFCLILNIKLMDIREQIIRWRDIRTEDLIGMATIKHLYKVSVEVADTVLTKNGQEVHGTKDEIFDYYRETRLNRHGSYDDKLHQFLTDIQTAYPGYLKLSLNRQ